MLTRVSVACGLLLAVLGSLSPTVQAAEWGSIARRNLFRFSVLREAFNFG